MLGCDANRPSNQSTDDRSSSADRATTQDPKQIILGLEREWAAALTRKDLAWYDRHVSPSYQTILDNGRILSRAEVIEHMRTAPPAQGLKLDQADVIVYGNAAIATATQSFARRDGRPGRLRATDVWIKSDSGRWVVVHTHETLVAVDQ